MGSGVGAVASCSSPAGGAPSDAGGVDTSFASDTAGDGQMETGAESAADSGGPSEAGCQPGSAAGFVPPPFVPSVRSTVCDGYNGDGGLVQSYGQACIGAGTYEACQQFVPPDDPDAQACYHCLVTGEDASEWGPVVIATQPLVNYAGCVQALDPTEAGAACAEVMTAAAVCSQDVCKTNCPVTDPASFNAYNNCYMESQAGACIGYWTSTAACVAAVQGDGSTPAAQTCFAGNRPVRDDYLALAHYFCGER